MSLTLQKQLEQLARTVARTLDTKQGTELLKLVLPKTLSIVDQNLSKIITQDSQIETLKTKIRLLVTKSQQHNILIVGETGTGKELLAQALHTNANEPFIAINCAAINESLVESEFFGAKRGSYTGCTLDREGYFEAAKNGTIFLDEISEIPLTLQAKLLRVIENRKFRRVGETVERNIDCRIISATNILNLNLLTRVFRQDLYYRLATITLTTTPLRDRVGDIELLVKKFDPANKITENQQMELKNSTFQGNVRELKNKVEELLLLAELSQ